MGAMRIRRVGVVVGMVVAVVAARPVVAVDGEHLFVHRCGFCHTYRGLGHRQIGPDLSASGALMGAERLRQYIEAPRSVDPRSRMPAVRSLRPAELAALVRFLAGERLAAGPRER